MESCTKTMYSIFYTEEAVGLIPSYILYDLQVRDSHLMDNISGKSLLQLTPSLLLIC